MPQALSRGELPVTLSLQYSGILHWPCVRVLPHGSVHLLFTLWVLLSACRSSTKFKLELLTLALTDGGPPCKDSLKEGPGVKIRHNRIGAAECCLSRFHPAIDYLCVCDDIPVTITAAGCFSSKACSWPYGSIKDLLSKSLSALDRLP